MGVTVYFLPGAHRGTRLWIERVCGARLLRCELPRALTPRGMRRCLSLLRRAGARDALNWPEGLGPAALPLVPTRRLWQASAGPCALLQLALLGIPPERATVELCAARADGPVRAAAEYLLPRVRALSLSFPGCDGYGWALQRRCGISVRSGAGDLALCFSPAPARSAQLALFDPRPAPPGLTLRAPGIFPPDGCPALPFFAHLERAGLLSARDLHPARDDT